MFPVSETDAQDVEKSAHQTAQVHFRGVCRHPVECGVKKKLGTNKKIAFRFPKRKRKFGPEKKIGTLYLGLLHKPKRAQVFKVMARFCFRASSGHTVLCLRMVKCYARTDYADPLEQLHVGPQAQ